MAQQAFPAEFGSDARMQPRPTAAVAILIALAISFLLPFMFAQLIVGGLRQLHLSPDAALFFACFMFVGAMINIPFWRIERTQWVMDDPLCVFGLGGLFPSLCMRRRETILAVNVGGCLAPVGLAIYELYHLASTGGDILVSTLIITVTNVLFCWSISRPVANVGVVMPVLLPAGLAASLALIFAPGHAAPVAFIAGVLGPLIGADLFHLSAVARTQVGVASIGGAGTFDGIVLSGLIAAYLS
jgi:uncharacterized membrane protein